MPDRLRETDAALLAAESARAPRQVAVVMVLQPGERGFDHDGLLRLIDDRIGLVPRYRQRSAPCLAACWVEFSAAAAGVRFWRGNEMVWLALRVPPRFLQPLSQPAK